MIAIGQSFSNIPIHLDGSTFVDCRFENCDLIFSAVLPVHLDRCTFNNCRPSFIGAANLTIQMMRGVYHGWGPNGRALIDNTFAQIKAATDTTSQRGGDPKVTN